MIITNSIKYIRCVTFLRSHTNSDFPVPPFFTLCVCVHVFLCTCMRKLCLSGLVYSGHIFDKHKVWLLNIWFAN